MSTLSIKNLENWAKKPHSRIYGEFLNAPTEKVVDFRADYKPFMYKYVTSFFKFGEKKDIEGLKLKGLKNNADLAENSKYLPHFITHISKGKGDEWREAILKLIHDHKDVPHSKFISSLYDALPHKYSKDYSRMNTKGGAFPVDHGSKRWTQKKNYKKWIKNLKKPVTRNAQREDLCVGEKSICKGHLGIPRKYMPQFNSPAEIRQFTRFVKRAYGIRSHATRKSARELKSSQREINKKRVKSLIDDNILKKVRTPILISGDDYVIDGHHRWAAYMLEAPEKKIPAVVIDAPIKDVLGIAVAWGAKHQEF
jgi:hypothetical protein